MTHSETFQMSLSNVKIKKEVISIKKKKKGKNTENLNTLDLLSCDLPVEKCLSPHIIKLGVIN